LYLRNCPANVRSCPLNLAFGLLHITETPDAFPELGLEACCSLQRCFDRAQEVDSSLVVHVPLAAIDELSYDAAVHTYIVLQ